MPTTIPLFAAATWYKVAILNLALEFANPCSLLNLFNVEEKELNNKIQAEDNSEKKNSSIQNTLQEKDKSTPVIENDDLTGEEE